MAPTGTISFAMDCGATSIEPFFSHMIYKKLSGGGFMTLANPVIGDALRHLGYAPEQVEEILAYVQATDDDGMVVDGKIEGAPGLRDACRSSTRRTSAARASASSRPRATCSWSPP